MSEPRTARERGPVRIREPHPRPKPLEQHSSVHHGTSILCADRILRVVSRCGLGGWRGLAPGWYQLSAEEVEDWAYWACWTAGSYQVGGLSWPSDDDSEEV